MIQVCLNEQNVIFQGEFTVLRIIEILWVFFQILKKRKTYVEASSGDVDSSLFKSMIPLGRMGASLG